MEKQQLEKVQLALELLNELPKEVNPRIGGSCALFMYGDVDNFDDIDIIVDSLVGVDLDYERLPLKHPHRLNGTKSYKVGDFKVDLHESIMPKAKGILEPKENILCCQKVLKRFVKIVYDEDMIKWN